MRKHYSFPNEGHLWSKNGNVGKYQHISGTSLHWRMAKGM